MHTLLLMLPLLLLPATAAAVIIDSGDGSGNTSAPMSDPGWDNVGLRGSLTAVYLGDGWVITAEHTGLGDVVFSGLPHQWVPGTEVTIQNPDSSFADLRLFAIHPVPNLPTLGISATAPAPGEEVVLAGNGRDRGAATSFDPNGPPPPGPIEGYLWLGSQSLRWGTNEVDSFDSIAIGSRITESFASSFDRGATAHEAVVANGDSGGAVFYDNGGEWELAGILFALGQFEGQPAGTALYGNLSWAVDLAFYRDAIDAAFALPEPRGGLWWGLAAVLLLHLRHHRHHRR